MKSSPPFRFNDLERSPGLRWTIALLVFAMVPMGFLAGSSFAESVPLPEFSETCTALTAARNPFFGRGVIDRLSSEIESIPEHEPSGPSATELGLQRALARLRLGDVQAAVVELDSLLADLPPQRLPTPSNEPATSRGLRQRAQWLSGVAALQLGEDANCLVGPHPDACIVPLRRGGQHRDAAWALRASSAFRDVVETSPEDPLALWLLNLSSALAGDSAQTLPSVLRLPGMLETRTTADSVFDQRWRNVASGSFPLSTTHQGDLAGGAVLDDFDGDGLLDLVTSTWDPCASAVALRNRGDGTFSDVTEIWNLSPQLGGLNLLQTDFDNDGMLDLLVLRGAWLLGDGNLRNSLLRGVHRDGQFTFDDVTRDLGLAEPARPTQAAAWADVDSDGDLDLYIGNEATATNPHASQLFLNPARSTSPDHRFLDVADRADVLNFRYAKGVAFGDYDNDGDPDLYVSNFGINRLYRNDTKPAPSGDGVPRFVDVAPQLDVTRPDVQSFATWWFDYDNDGDLDLFVADYRSQSRPIAASYGARAERLKRTPADGGQPLLYRNLLIETGEVGFREVSKEVGLWRPSMPMGANFADLDNDGWLDFVLGTGEPDLASVLPNQAWVNREGHFREVTAESGLGHLQKGHGIAFGDVDHDGDQDLLHQLGGFYPVDRFPNALFENPTRGSSSGNSVGAVAPAASRWITLELQGRNANRAGVGARVRLDLDTTNGPRTLFRTVGSGGSFGGSSLRLEVGLGDALAIRSVEIRWPGGAAVQRFSIADDLAEATPDGRNPAARPSALPLDSFVRVVEGSSEVELLSRPKFTLRPPLPSSAHAVPPGRGARP